MNKNPQTQTVVGLDIGTSKIAAMVGEVHADNSVNVLGLGCNPSRGLKRGMVVDVDSTVASIQKAVREAELMAGIGIRSAYTGIAGSHISSFNSHGIVAIRNQEVDEHDVDRVLEAARAVSIPADQQILHVLEREYVIDQHGGIRQPIGMSGVRLEAHVHLVSGAVSAAQNIAKCVNRCGLPVDDIVLEQLASSYAVLSGDEKDLGICLVDIGAGTTDIAIFTDGAIAHSAVIPIAGDQVTHDIAVSLRTPHRSAEELKINHACADRHLVDREEMIEVSGIGKGGGRQLSRSTLIDIVRPRYEELLELIQREVERSGHAESITAGYVLCGGSASMVGLQELAESMLNAPVRIGVPECVQTMQSVVGHPSYATCVGLLLYGATAAKTGKPRSVGLFDEIKQTMKSWFASS